MASRAFEEFFDATLPVVEAVAVDPTDPKLPCYPHLSLRQTEKEIQKSIRMVVLENSYLRVSICPDLGGRIFRILDKRTNFEILNDRADLNLSFLGDRGVYLMDGITFFGDDCRSPNSMSKVDYVIHQPEDDEGSAAVMTFSLLVGSGLSLQTCITLPPDRAEVLVEMRIHNRTLLPVRYSCGCCVSFGSEIRYTTYYPGDDVGLHFEGADEDIFCDVYCVPEGHLAPREIIEHQMRIIPYNGLGGILTGSSDLVANIHEGELRLTSTSQMDDCKIFLLTEDGLTLETDAHFDPTKIFRASLPDNVTNVTILDKDKNELLSFSCNNVTHEKEAPFTSTISEELWSSSFNALYDRTPQSIEDLVFTDVVNLHKTDPVTTNTHSVPVHLRGLTNLIKASQAAASAEYRSADISLNDALSTLSEDPLTWWLKAIVRRLVGENDEERTELLNAHYLSPMEPALRAESFLSLDQTMGSEPNPIMKPLVDDQDALHEVVHLLVEAGLFSESARLIDEALRHRASPLLRYMLAWCLLRNTRMAAEASEQIRAVSGEELGSPFPWRPFERRAVLELATEFPTDKRLATLAKMVEENKQWSRP